MMGTGAIEVRRAVEDPKDLLSRAYSEALTSGYLLEAVARMTPPLIERAARQGDYDRVRSLAETALDRSLPGAPILAAEVVAAAAMAEADRERLPKAGGAAPGDSPQRVALWIERLEKATATMVDVPACTAAYAQRAHLELRRMTRSATEEQWSTLGNEWLALGNPYQSAYAWFRAAEAALMGTNPNRDIAERRLKAAHASARTLGATTLLDDIRTLGRHSRISVRDHNSEPPPEITTRDGTNLDLTARELDVLRLLVEGLSNGDIGKELFITTKTASTHVSNILRKMDASNRVEAATLAHRIGIVD